LIVEHASRTDTGRVRSRNEDSFSAAPDIGLYIVADGMGGQAGGDEASRYACLTIEEYVRRRHEVLQDYESDPAPERRRAVFQLLEEAIRAASERIIKEGESHTELGGMATTAVVLLLLGEHAFVANLGDSRAYLLRDGYARLLTEDHSLFFELIRQGRLSRDATGFPYKNVVTRALGVRGTALADTFDFEVMAGDRFILCTDGLHGYMDDEEAYLLAANGKPDTAAERLVEFALDSGGADNVTVVLADVKSIDGDDEEVRERDRVMSVFPILAGIDFGDRVRMISQFDHRMVEDGQTLFQEGEEADGLYCVVSGSVEIRRADKAVVTFGPGANLGEISLVEKRPRLATALARGAVDVLVLRRQVFGGMVRRSPRLASKLLYNLVRTLAHRLRGTNDELVILKTHFNTEGVDLPKFLSSDELDED